MPSKKFAIIVSIALRITVVFAGKYPMMTRYMSTKDFESDRDYTAPETRNYLCSRSVPRSIFGIGYFSETKEGSADHRDGKQSTW